MKKPSSSQCRPANSVFEAVKHGKCKAEYYTSKSYIRRMESGRLTLLVGCTGPYHWEVVAQLVAHVAKGKSKEELLAVRARLMQELQSQT